MYSMVMGADVSLLRLFLQDGAFVVEDGGG
jgi:hypothetical protein